MPTFAVRAQTAFMKKFLLALFLASVTAMAFGQENRVKLHGIVLNIESLQPIQYPTIETLKSGKRYIGNKKGVFDLEVNEDDSVFISAIGYIRVRIRVDQIMARHPGDSVLILLKPTIYELRDVTVYRSTKRQDSLARAAAHILASDSLLNNNDRIFKRPRGKLYVGSGVVYEGLIQDLYNRFSKEGKENIRFEEFVAYARSLRRREERYNKTVVHQVTGLEEPALDEFMLYCKLENSFVLTATDYDLLAAIKRCGEEFQHHRK
jgi:hypothetical protein